MKLRQVGQKGHFKKKKKKTLGLMNTQLGLKESETCFTKNMYANIQSSVILDIRAETAQMPIS